VFSIWTLFCTFCNGQSLPSNNVPEHNSTTTPSNAVNDLPQAPQPQTQVTAVTANELINARTLSAGWAKTKADNDKSNVTYVKIGAALIGIVAAGVGGGMRLDKHYAHAGTVVTIAAGTVGGGLNVYALIKDLRDSHNLNAEYAKIPQNIVSYIQKNFSATNIQTLPTHPSQFSDILNNVQLELMLSNAQHQR